jgi:tRNA dimethylallyltransferase
MKKLIVVVGPTASGKTNFAINLARKLSTEIISADSRQIYKNLEISTAQPSVQDKNLAFHHLVCFVEIFENYNTYQYVQDANFCLNKIFEKNNFAIVCGGTGLYIDSLINGIDYFPDICPSIREKLNFEFQEKGLSHICSLLEKVDPEYFDIVDRKNPRRILRGLEIFFSSGKPFSFFRKNQKKNREFEVIKYGISLEKRVLEERIDSRLESMIENGLFEEIESVLSYKNCQAINTIGVKEIFDFFEKKIDKKTSILNIKSNTKKYAKRQMTWFKKCKETIWDQNIFFEKLYKS